MNRNKSALERRRKGRGMKDGSGKGKGMTGGLRRNKTSTCRHPNSKGE